MILDALVGLYERLAEREEVAAEGWCKAKVSYAVNLSEEGRITGILPMKTEADRGKKKVWVPVSLMVPEMVTRSSGVQPIFYVTIQSISWGSMRMGQVPGSWSAFRHQGNGI